MGVAQADTRAQVRGAFPVAAERAGIPVGAFPAEIAVTPRAVFPADRLTSAHADTRLAPVTPVAATSLLLTGDQATADITVGASTWVLALTVGILTVGMPTTQATLTTLGILTAKATATIRVIPPHRPPCRRPAPKVHMIATATRSRVPTAIPISSHIQRSSSMRSPSSTKIPISLN